MVMLILLQILQMMMMMMMMIMMMMMMMMMMMINLSPVILLFQLAAEFTKPGGEGEQLHALLEARGESTDNWVRVRKMLSFNKQQTVVATAIATGAVEAAHQYI